MADKLPVLVAIIYTADNGKKSVLGCEPESDAISVTGIQRASKAALDSGTAKLSRYEPAAPRCKTCVHHDVREGEPTAFCCQWSRWLHSGDGSGYCHEHRDRRSNARPNQR